LLIATIVLAATCIRARAEIASWYGSESGRYTASGERFRPEAFTCAHRTYAFGTHLRVTYRGRSVVCRVNDRGPARWTGSSIDLSKGAARAIGLIPAGRGRVSIERL